MLRLIGSTAPGVVDVDKNVTELRQKLTSHDFFNSADAGLKKKVQNGNVPPFHLSHADRNKRAGVNHEYYNAAVMFLSSYVHTYPFSVHQLMEFRAGDFLTVRTLTFHTRYVFFLIHHATREIVHVRVTRHPTAAWTGQQVVNACFERVA